MCFIQFLFDLSDFFTTSLVVWIIVSAKASSRAAFALPKSSSNASTASLTTLAKETLFPNKIHDAVSCVMPAFDCRTGERRARPGAFFPNR
jgi:hypothetical protein